MWGPAHDLEALRPPTGGVQPWGAGRPPTRRREERVLDDARIDPWSGPEDTRTDAELVAAFVTRREARAFRSLYRRHAPYVYPLIRRLLGGASEAEDVLQETWLRAAERLGSFRGESALRTWLAGIAVRCCREHARAVLRRPWTVPEDARGEASGARAASGDGRAREGAPGLDLERALLGLADGYRQVLVLHDVAGFTHEEVAAMLGIEPGTSKSQLSRARAALRQALRGGDDGRG